MSVVKNSVVVSLAVLATGLCAAQEVGRVISSTPVVQQLGVPRQICTNEAYAVPVQKSGAGVALGAIAGGALGNTIGQGGGRAAATMLGIIGGAVVGDRVEGQDSQLQHVQRCTSQTVYENRLSNYNVVYEYAGKQYAVQLPYDPGPTLKLQVTPADSMVQQSQSPLTYVQPPETPPIYTQPAYVAPVYGQPVYTRPVVVAERVYYPAYPAYPGYYGSPYYPPVGVNLQFGFSSGHHRHGHWR